MSDFQEKVLVVIFYIAAAPICLTVGFVAFCILNFILSTPFILIGNMELIISSMIAYFILEAIVGGMILYNKWKEWRGTRHEE